MPNVVTEPRPYTWDRANWVPQVQLGNKLHKLPMLPRLANWAPHCVKHHIFRKGESIYYDLHKLPMLPRLALTSPWTVPLTSTILYRTTNTKPITQKMIIYFQESFVCAQGNWIWYLFIAVILLMNQTYTSIETSKSQYVTMYFYCMQM
jgi:hypothetical protein